MNLKRIYTTSVFKVKNARAFRKDLEEVIKAEKVDLKADPEGFRLWIEEAIEPEYRPGKSLDNKIISFIQKHLRSGTHLYITCTIMDSANQTSVIDLHVITPMAYKVVTIDECVSGVHKNLFPRYVNSHVVVKHYFTKQWLEKDKKYKALRQERARLRSYLIIEHEDGRKVRWPKEYFYEE